ncbi:hypothetical protein EUGRSUZ_G02124, partial [Eucalyptus grandis]
TLLVFQSFEFGHSEAFTNVSCFGTEREALLKFRQGLIDHSKRLSSWTSKDCCEWKVKKTGHVFKLDLRNPFCETFLPGRDVSCSDKSSLAGKIHASLAELKHLKYLDLSLNNFSKQKIPQFFSTLQRLEYLNLSNAGFDGNIPPHLGNLSNLRYLDLTSWFGKGDLTTDNLRWVSKSSSLKYFHLANIDLRKAKDWFSSINMLSSLQSLQLTGCSLEKLPDYLSVNFTSLRFLDLGSSIIYSNSTIPPWFYNFSKLEHIDLNRTYLKGTFPRTLFDNNQQLSFLDLSFNLLDGQILKNFNSLYKFRVLNLADNKFDGDLGSIVHGPLESAKSDLRICDFSRNNFSGHIPYQFGSLEDLEELSLSYNSMSGPIPVTLGELSSLRELRLSNNKLDGVVGEMHFANLTSLIALGISNSLSGSIPNSLCAMGSLSYLDLSKNQLSGRLPLCLKNLKQLNVISLTRLVQLQNLNLSQNNLSGKIPTNIGDLKKLESLDLSNNKISGRIPPSISSMDFLCCLNLSFNNLSGLIPSSIHLRTMDDEFMFRSNDGLCGAPLLKVFPRDEQHPDIDGQDGDSRNWFYAGLGPGFTIRFLGFCSALHFKQSWRISYFQAIDKITEKLMILGIITTLRFKRAF